MRWYNLCFQAYLQIFVDFFTEMPVVKVISCKFKLIGSFHIEPSIWGFGDKIIKAIKVDCDFHRVRFLMQCKLIFYFEPCNEKILKDYP